MSTQSSFGTAAKICLPIVFFSVPVGIIYGVFFEQSGYPWYMAPLFSLFVFGGSVQLLALSMMSDSAPVWAIGIAVLPIAIRNSFYGLSVIERFRCGPWLRAYLAHGLVDTCYAILSGPPHFDDPKKDLHYCVWVTVLAHATWVISTAIGAFGATYVSNEWQGLEFSFVAIFCVLALEMFLKERNRRPYVVAALGLICGLIVGGDQFLLPAIILSVTVLLLLIKREQV